MVCDVFVIWNTPIVLYISGTPSNSKYSPQLNPDNPLIVKLTSIGVNVLFSLSTDVTNFVTKSTSLNINIFKSFLPASLNLIDFAYIVSARCLASSVFLSSAGGAVGLVVSCAAKNVFLSASKSITFIEYHPSAFPNIELS